MKKIVLNKGKLTLVEDQVVGFLERTVTPFGISTRVNCPKEYQQKGRTSPSWNDLPAM
jgi:putative transposon-encoded protein